MDKRRHRCGGGPRSTPDFALQSFTLLAGCERISEGRVPRGPGWRLPGLRDRDSRSSSLRARLRLRRAKALRLRASAFPSGQGDSTPRRQDAKAQRGEFLLPTSEKAVQRGPGIQETITRSEGVVGSASGIACRVRGQRHWGHGFAFCTGARAIGPHLNR